MKIVSWKNRSANKIWSYLVAAWRSSITSQVLTLKMRYVVGMRILILLSKHQKTLAKTKSFQTMNRLFHKFDIFRSNMILPMI